MEITYLEGDDDEALRTQRPRLPQAPSSRRTHRAPVPRGPVNAAWFICVNETCVKYGHVATGKNTPTLVEKKGKCGACRGLGVRVDEDGDTCDTCGGSGRKVLSSKEVVLPINCPHCRQAMEPLEEDESPNQFPRMDTAHSDREGSGLPDDGNSQAGVSFGRSRTIS